MLKNQTGKKLDVNIAALPEGSYQAQVAAQNVQWSANFMKH